MRAQSQRFRIPLLALAVCALAGLAVAQDDHGHAAPAGSVEHAAEHFEHTAQSVAEDGVGGPASTGPDYNLPPLEFDVGLFLFTLLLFGIFVLGMRKSVWVPLVQNLNSREERIAKAEADARAARQEVEKLGQDAERRLAEVRDQVGKMLAEARASAEARKLEILAQAEQDAQRIKSEALAEIARARQEALYELEQTVGEQVSVATAQVAGRRM